MSMPNWMRSAIWKKMSDFFLFATERMLYNINEPEWKNCKGWLDEDAIKRDNFYNVKPTKTIRNEAIE